jgi:hypothetical protein
MSKILATAKISARLWDGLDGGIRKISWHG